MQDVVLFVTWLEYHTKCTRLFTGIREGKYLYLEATPRGSKKNKFVRIKVSTTQKDPISVMSGDVEFRELDLTKNELGIKAPCIIPIKDLTLKKVNLYDRIRSVRSKVVGYD